MQKFFRSLIAVGVAFGLAACGDDVSITEPPVADLVITGAPVTAVNVGDKVQLSANQAVTWTTSNSTVASVDASGLVTANAAGTASITATSSADATKKASVTITVSGAGNAPATVSIQSVTFGTTATPVNFNNVFGQIDVSLNVDPGDQNISKVEILLNNNVVYTQTFAGAALNLEANAALSAGVIVGSIYTNAFNPTTGAVTYPNGNYTLSARLTGTDGTTTASGSLVLIFNNASGWVVSMTNTGTNTGFPASAVNSSTGFGWTQGTHELKLVAVNYAGGNVTLTNVNVTMFGVTTTLTPAAGTQVFTASFSAASTWNGTNLRLGNYMSAAGELPSINSSTLSTGQAGAVTFLNHPSLAAANGLAPFALVRVDNTAPGANSANGVAQTAAVVGTMPLWVNASFAYAPNSVFTSGADDGSGGVTKKFWSIAGALPGSANSCTFTGMTAVTTGANLAETTVSTTYSTRVQVTDAVGNSKCYDITGTNGADFVAPSITNLTGPADQSGTNVALGNFVFSVTDNASGFGATPVSANISRVGTSGSTACVVAPSGTCSGGFVGLLPLTFDATNSTNVEGYYTISNWTVSDQALNSVSVASRTYLYDATAPAFSGGMSLQPLYTGNATATFTSAATDNLDLASVYGVLGYPTGSFRYPSQTIGAYNVPLEKSANITFTVANFMRCVNAAGDYTANAANQANAVDLVVADHGGNTASFGGFTIPSTNVEACGVPGATTINSFPTAVTYPGTKTQVDIDGASLATASATSATLSAVADVPLNTSVDPFARVEFYYSDGTNWHRVGSANGVLAQTPSTRTYTYTFVWDPAAGTTTGAAVPVVAIGVDAQGDAVFAAATTIVIVP